MDKLTATRTGRIFTSLAQILLALRLARYLVLFVRLLNARGPSSLASSIHHLIAARIFRVLLHVPSNRKKFDSEIAQARDDIRKKVAPKYPDLPSYETLPESSHSREDVFSLLDKHAALPAAHWSDGKVSGAVYHGGEELSSVISAAFEKFVISNPLHPDVFPGIRKMEAEVVSMVLSLFNAPLDAAGAMTSGGTESIVMACKSYRDWALAEKSITSPEMIVPSTAHAAFDKAASYFNIKIHHIPVKSNRQVDIAKVKRAINPNTIMIVGSAPNFPDGTTDNIVELSKLAKKSKIGLHVDCCLGSFIVPFLDKAGFPVDPFDFRLEGVTSISCDTHKYGFAPKGSSVIMYHSKSLRRYQYFVTTYWPGGVYASPSIAGSRPGSLIAGTWAALIYMGHQGYLDSCTEIVTTTRKIVHLIKTDSVVSDQMEILGIPNVTVVAFQSKKDSKINIYHVGDIMSSKGWHLNALQNPPALHICCTRLTIGHEDEFIRDLREAVSIAPESAETGQLVQLYGLGSSTVTGPTVVKELASIFIDSLYAI